MIGSLKASLAAARGADAERRAEDFLRAKGLIAVTRNWRCKAGELDLVMRHDDTLVIVEVRARQHAGYGGAAASVDHRKQAKLITAAQWFLQAHAEWANAPVRFDVVSFEANGNCAWLPDAFDAGARA